VSPEPLEQFADRLERFARREQAKQKSVPRARSLMPTHKVVHLLDLNDVQRAWRVSAHTVYNLLEQGRIRVFAVPGRRKRYSVDDIIEALGYPKEIDVLAAAIASVIESKRSENLTVPYRSQRELKVA
jgi:Helix-turn-helix domain